MKAIHPIIYKCNDFIFYLEEWNGLNLLHVKIIKFSHNIFKKGKKVIYDLLKTYKTLHGYGEDKETVRLMEMVGFKHTGFFLRNSNNVTGELLCLQQQQH